MDKTEALQTIRQIVSTLKESQRAIVRLTTSEDTPPRKPAQSERRLALVKAVNQ